MNPKRTNKAASSETGSAWSTCDKLDTNKSKTAPFRAYRMCLMWTKAKPPKALIDLHRRNSDVAKDKCSAHGADGIWWLPGKPSDVLIFSNVPFRRTLAFSHFPLASKWNIDYAGNFGALHTIVDSTQYTIWNYLEPSIKCDCYFSLWLCF